MKKGIKMLAVGSMLAAGLFVSSKVNAVSDMEYNLNLYKKYVILTDEGKVTIPATYHFDDGTNDGYNLNLNSLKTTVNNAANVYTDTVSYNSQTSEFASKYGIKLSGFSGFDKVLLQPNGMLNNNLTNAQTKDQLVRVAIIGMLRNSRINQITTLQQKLDAAQSDYERKAYSTQIQNYNEDVAAWENLNLNDLPADVNVYNCVTTASSRASLAQVNRANDGTHLGDIYNINYYYYTIIIRDLRLNEIKYKVNGADETAVASFDKDTKTYNVKLPVNTPKNATITTASKSYALEQDAERGWEYDSGITVQDANITLNNGTGTAKVKVKFNATPYGDTGNYEKEYTLNFSTLAYQKGDVNKDTFINATDAAVVLDLFKNGNATQDNYDYGDMNNDNLLNSTDAAMILDIFKN